jgi:hypothetical protein
MFKRTYGRWGLKDGEGNPRWRLVEANSTGGQDSRRTVEPGGVVTSINGTAAHHHRSVTNIL